MHSELPKVADLLSLALESDIPEAEFWIAEYRRSLHCTNGFFDGVLTEERAAYVVDDLRTVLSTSLSFIARMNTQYYLEMCWRAHVFMNEVRQKMIGFGIDVDVDVFKRMRI